MSGSLTGLSAVAMYPIVAANETKDIASFQASDPTTKQAIAYFQQVAPSITSPAALLGNYRALSVVLNAFGMSSDISSTALLRQLMTQDPTSASSVAAKSENPLFTRFAKFMSNWSPPPFSTASGIATIVNQVATNNFEAQQGTEMPGMQEALYFTRNIGSATTVPQLISDQNLLKVVAPVATGMTYDQFAQLDYSQQVSLLTKDVDLTKFSSTKYTQQYAERYLAEQQSQSGTQSPVLTLFGGGSSNESTSLLSALYPSATAATGTLASLFATTSSASTAGTLGALFSASA
jgi:hypothetical protein